MTKNEKELFDLLEREGLEVVNVSGLDVELEGMQVTHAIAMENWRTKEKSVSLTNGEPHKYTLYWDSSSGDEEYKKEFDRACSEIVRLF